MGFSPDDPHERNPVDLREVPSAASLNCNLAMLIGSGKNIFRETPLLTLPPTPRRMRVQTATSAPVKARS